MPKQCIVCNSEVSDGGQTIVIAAQTLWIQTVKRYFIEEVADSLIMAFHTTLDKYVNNMTLDTLSSTGHFVLCMYHLSYIQHEAHDLAGVA